MNSIALWTSEWATLNKLHYQFEKLTNSTNILSKISTENLNSFMLFITETQSSGRGRGNHSWASGAPGSNLLSTWRFPLDNIPQPLLNMRIGLSLYQSLMQTWPSIEFALKAPNDIYITSGKCAGILTEVVTGEHIFLHIGIGLNVFSKPQIKDQNTACLSEAVSINISDWFLFCNTLHADLSAITQKNSTLNLSATERQQLLFGLKKYLGNHIKDIKPDGSLILKDNSIINWNQL